VSGTKSSTLGSGVYPLLQDKNILYSSMNLSTTKFTKTRVKLMGRGKINIVKILIITIILTILYTLSLKYVWMIGDEGQ
jgi:hypothetical protein